MMNQKEQNNEIKEFSKKPKFITRFDIYISIITIKEFFILKGVLLFDLNHIQCYRFLPVLYVEV